MQLANLKPALRDLPRHDALKIIMSIRKERRIPKKATVERAQKAKKKGVVTKSSAKSLLNNLSPEQAQMLLNRLQGDG